ncbi:flagellar assembly protein FliW [Methylogaea oryzae]|uniref:Flagellar assembly factor FliW n=1 Tax=Methylogaea oryzae TaxID=1295382 RepID=A0A8D5AKF4_9GAMM|nr:flagellar assembly protein FliW [Methylogaea oryzae]BBL71071.1 flagellar assembly factor FliW [Methylogaea oryzae]
MMQIETRDGSTQQVDPGSVITFPEGLTSFEDCKKFKLFHQQDANAPIVYWLQSIDSPEVIFNVAFPYTLNVDYDFELNGEDIALLGAESAGDLVVMLLLYKSAPDLAELPTVSVNKNVNAALRAPLIINTKKLLGIQKPMYDASISVLVKNQLPTE